MRNVPPLPANYWQRAGRAGRRHRMAVDLTYCRAVSHDRAYFADPLKLLGGRVDPPAFNLRNDLMVAKHVHATVVTRLHQYVRDASRRAERSGSESTTRCDSACPSQVTSYLFDDGVVRDRPFDLSPLRAAHRPAISTISSPTWSGPFGRAGRRRTREVTTAAELRRHVVGILRRPRRGDRSARAPPALGHGADQAPERRPGEAGRARARRRRAASGAAMRSSSGSRAPTRRRRREAEGYDDVNTFGVLAAEGFLPGYGLEVGSVLGTAEIPFWRTGAMEFTLPRPPSVALREYVPGNLIYANGNRFVARRFHRDVDEQRVEMPVFEVSTERQAVKETSATSGARRAGRRHPADHRGVRRRSRPPVAHLGR